MDGDHPRIMTGPALDRATGAKPALVPPRVPELEQTLDPNQRHTGDEQDTVQSSLLTTSKT
jgi:hypothetical protein